MTAHGDNLSWYYGQWWTNVITKDNECQSVFYEIQHSLHISMLGSGTKVYLLAKCFYPRTQNFPSKYGSGIDYYGNVY